MKTAKDIFWDYSCNHFFLDRDGMLDEYIKLGGNNPIDEKKWRAEFIQFWFDQITDNDVEVFRKLGDVEAIEILDQLIQFNTFKDDYIKFWYAFELLSLSKLTKNYILRLKAKNRTYEIFKELTDRKIYVSDENKSQINNEMMEAFGAKTQEEYLTNYSQRKLTEF